MVAQAWVPDHKLYSTQTQLSHTRRQLLRNLEQPPHCGVLPVVSASAAVCTASSECRSMYCQCLHGGHTVRMWPAVVGLPLGQQCMLEWQRVLTKLVFVMPLVHPKHCLAAVV
jgi:hypothetical protein